MIITTLMMSNSYGPNMKVNFRMIVKMEKGPYIYQMVSIFRDILLMILLRVKEFIPLLMGRK
jgi:hypothetical protein